VVEARTDCKAIQFDVSTTQMLHEKDSFIQRTKEFGLTVPDTHSVTDRADVKTALQQAPSGRRYIMKPVGMDDANRGDMTLLPLETPAATSNHLSKLRISKEAPWILQQFIDGPEYCTHSVVVEGVVKAFVACPSAELLMHYQALPSNSALHHAMLEFTRGFASKGGKTFTGHLSFDFMIDKTQMKGPNKVKEGEDPVLYPIECNPRAHTAVVLFNETNGIPDAYLSVLDRTESDPTRAPITPQCTDKYYWIGHDFVELLIIPMIKLLLLQSASLKTLPENALTFWNHVIHWQDGTFERWDAIPWWWLYHGYWPARFLQCFRQGKIWSRINVSTTKMFES
jgi:hypothetical protein